MVYFKFQIHDNWDAPALTIYLRYPTDEQTFNLYYPVNMQVSLIQLFTV